jgi:hypothetical protein
LDNVETPHFKLVCIVDPKLVQGAVKKHNWFDPKLLSFQHNYFDSEFFLRKGEDVWVGLIWCPVLLIIRFGDDKL